MQLLYNFGIAFFSFLLRIAAPFNVKAKQLLIGRRDTWQKLKLFQASGKVIWVHCASLGEFEQGRPLIEAIKAQFPAYKIALTFFSPSGYEIRKNYNMADLVVYLPADTPSNAKRFIKAINPSMAFFVKYEFWYHYYKCLKKSEIQVYSISTIFRQNQVFFKWYGGWYRSILKAVSRFYVQDQKSGQLLEQIGLKNYVVAGDTRFDRVTAIAQSAAEVPEVRDFAAHGKVLVAGSSWPADEAILAEYINNAGDDVKLIIAPHEVHESHISQLEQRFKVQVGRFSKKDNTSFNECRVLIIDTIGLLSAIYRYGSVAYIGGGFGKGIHNTLEAATYGVPVIFGPNHKKFKEALDLIQVGGGFAIESQHDFNRIMESLWNPKSDKELKLAGDASRKYVLSMCGATPLIMKELF